MKPNYAAQAELLDNLARQWVDLPGPFSQDGAYLDLDSTPPVLYLSFGNLAMLTKATAIINIPIIMGSQSAERQAANRIVNQLNQVSGPMVYSMVEDQEASHLHGRIAIPEKLLTAQAMQQAARLIETEIYNRDWQPIAQEIGGMISTHIPALHLKKLKGDD